DHDDSDYFNKSFDYLSAGEEELIQLRTRKANKSKIRPPLILDMVAFASTSRATTSNKNEVLVEHDDFIADLLRKLRVMNEEKFVDAAELKDCLTYYALSNGYLIWFERCSLDVLFAVCGQQRKQFRYPSVCKEDIKSLKPEHNCVRNFKFGSIVDYKWIGRHFGDKIRKNPEIKLCDIADLAMSEYEKTRKEHYRLLRSYGKELLDTNPGSTVKLRVINTDDKTYFDRFYVCFVGLKEGFKNGYRRVVALDGCFLKSPNQGEILNAIGRDGNNNIYPIAWVVINVENKVNRSCFLELLGADLDMPTGQGLTLVSWQHKGLIEAVKQVMPDAEHMQCA
ncbi:multidrug resistance-associated protein 5, partial [Tanacetum coccineum]